MSSDETTPRTPRRWECGPHTNGWGGHDARCRQVPVAEAAPTLTDAEVDVLVYEAGPDADHDALVQAVERILAERLDAEPATDGWDTHDGCDCAELCAMGPTCPGGMLAELPGSGCHRTTEPAPDADAAALARVRALRDGWARDVATLRADAAREADVEADWHADSRQQHLDFLDAALADPDQAGGEER